MMKRGGRLKNETPTKMILSPGRRRPDFKRKSGRCLIFFKRKGKIILTLEIH